METLAQYEAVQFRVALLLKQYKFGAASAAKYLGKTRGLVQSWMQIGNKHYLAKENIKLNNFEKIVKKLRRKITEEHLDYFLVMRLIDLKLPVAFVSRIMELPTSTVRSWRYGKVPSEIKKFFYDSRIIDREFNKLLKNIKTETTQNNLEYYLTIRLAKAAKSETGRRRIGGRNISQILGNHFGNVVPIPEKTISCWIDGKRKPWDSFDVLTDDNIIRREFNKIVDELTYKYLTYHSSKILAEEHNWKYQKISEILGVNKELVRGWIKKNRGNPVAKTFLNPEIVNREVEKYIDSGDLLPEELAQVENVQRNKIKMAASKFNQESEKDEIMNELNKELEQELIYHLETIPTGVTSIKVLKSILIDHRKASLDEIERTLEKSEQIIHNNGKWILKKYIDKADGELQIEEELARINCEKGQNDEIIC